MHRATTAISLILITAQSTAPAFANGNWELLRGVEVEEIVGEDSYEVRKVFPAEIEDGIEKFDITGYVAGLWTEENVQEFILISDMGFCPFCGDPEHGTALQVKLDTPMAVLQEGQRVTLRGQLEAVRDPRTTQSTRLTGARVLP